MCEHERAQHPSRPLFKGNLACAPLERQAAKVIEPLEKVGPKSRWPWVGRPMGSAGPRVGPLAPPLARCLFNGYELWKYGAWPKVCSKKYPNYFFQRILKLRKYFWSFYKKGKMLEKFQHAENNFENFKHAVEKNK